jgi:amidohydrolase
MLPDLVNTLSGEMIQLRRAIHRRPELAFAEFETTRRVASSLDALGVSYQVQESETGLVADIGNSGPMVAYRAELDGLPLHEESDLEFRSEVDGLMHACGHDAHTAIGVGIAGVLNQVKDLPGRARILFQPAEEGFPGGAEKMLEAQALGDATSILAVHVDPSLLAGQIGLKTGPITSSSDRFRIELTGPGGHTARPHETADTILAAGKIITELEGLLTRHTDVREPRVLTFGQVNGGKAANVIPASVVLEGTLRIAGDKLWSEIGGIFEKLIHQIVAPTGVAAAVGYEIGIAPVINSDTTIQSVGAAAESFLAPDAVQPTYTSMGAEDFSVFTSAIPGALVRLGSQAAGGHTPLHSSRFTLDEDAIGTGMLLGAASLLEMMKAAG